MKETKLLTKEILKKFKTVGNQNKEKDPLIICKLFYPDFSWTRYATEYDPKLDENYDVRLKEIYGLIRVGFQN